ncbi:hypothetical protein NOI24_08405 [Neorhizobium galegae]|uniref:hypothetical protein n=1 Tax=Neorhizobium galegae TaxID=399 RepID=UPI00210329F8|nr:hypothetical protein [Neorhizobium galegae]MCQ1771318.1 hypothetical protein [Neorhizobium galegae]MCQ1799796.1 hypothetical protein [Neorhizobium galegae]
MRIKIAIAAIRKMLRIAASTCVCVGISSSMAVADSETSVRAAYALCSVVDGTGLASSPCEVSGWGSSVTATIDMNSTEARDLCQKVASLMRQKGVDFDRGWTFQIKSPYSGGNSIAYCSL